MELLTLKENPILKDCQDYIICNHLGVYMEKAFREKETLNAHREGLDKSTNS
jgi:hypothetical protein